MKQIIKRLGIKQDVSVKKEGRQKMYYDLEYPYNRDF